MVPCMRSLEYFHLRWLQRRLCRGRRFLKKSRFWLLSAMPTRSENAPASAVFVLLLGMCPSAFAIASKPLIRGPIDDTHPVTLERGTHPSALRPGNDRGRVADDLPLDHVLLTLKRSPEREAALGELIEAMHDPASPEYHHWLTPAQLGSEYGPAPDDIAQVRGWLESRGLQVNYIYRNGLVIDFSGSASLVAAAFHTEIHALALPNGETHIGNISDPQIPAALSPVVRGVASLNDFFPRPRLKRLGPIAYDHEKNRWDSLFTLTDGGKQLYAVSPYDFATIYDLLPLWNRGYTGKGMTIAVIEDTSLAHPQDWTTFRQTFGLSKFATGSFRQIYPQSGDAGCSMPSQNGDEGEAALDAEWASATAPEAAIELVACANSRTTSGLDSAILNLLDATPPDIMSESYGGCESQSGAAAIALADEEAKEAAAMGVTFFIAQGDSGADECAPSENTAYSKLGINSGDNTASAYAVDVGGTDFAAEYESDVHGIAIGNYWMPQNQAGTLSSARSYIPEIPWNDSCASRLIYSDPKHGGAVRSYGSHGFCNTFPGQEDFLNNFAGGGGPSSCFTGKPSIPGVVGGTCKGNPKPTWQSGVVGIPNDGVRDQPDISLFAADGIAWHNSYVFCMSDTQHGGTTCTPSNDAIYLGGGGTSFAAPAMAGIQALIDQKYGRQGNANHVYYALAAAQLKKYGAQACSASQPNGALPAASCVFHDITQGDIAIPCGRNDDDNFYDCFGVDTANVGELSTSKITSLPAFAAGVGYDFATGLGSVDATNLFNAWQAKQ